MSGGSKNTTTTVQQIPEWMSKAGESTFGDAKGYMQSTPVVPYGGTMAPPVNQVTKDAAAAAANAATAGEQSFASAGQMAEKATGGATPQVNVGSFNNAAASKYMSPYVAQVQDRTVLEMLRQNEMGMDRLGDQAQAASAYGGLRHAVEGAELGKFQNNNILDYLARSNQAAYENAQAQFERDRAAAFGADTFNVGSYQADRDRELAAGGLYKDIGGTQAQAADSSVRNQLLAGQALFEQEAAGTDAAYQEWLRTQQEPWSRYADLMGMLAGAPHDTRGTTTEKQGTNWLNTALSVGAMAAAAIPKSDRRLKENIVKLGEADDGLGIYQFDYVDHPLVADVPKGPWIGVMADEVAELRPWALGPVEDGYASVDYGRL